MQSIKVTKKLVKTGRHGLSEAQSAAETRDSERCLFIPASSHAHSSIHIKIPAKLISAPP